MVQNKKITKNTLSINSSSKSSGPHRLSDLTILISFNRLFILLNPNLFHITYSYSTYDLLDLMINT